MSSPLWFLLNRLRKSHNAFSFRSINRFWKKQKLYGYYLGEKIKENYVGRAGSTYVREKNHAGFGVEYLKNKNCTEYVGVDWRILLKWMFKRENRKSWTGCMWRRLRTFGSIVSTRWWKLGFHKMREICGLSRNYETFMKDCALWISFSY